MSASVVCVHLCIGRLMQLTRCWFSQWYAIAGSFPSQSACCFFMQTPKCNQNQPIWIFNFSFILLLRRFALVKSGRALRRMSFHFHYMCDLVHNICIHAVSNTDFRSATDDDESVLKMKVYGALFGSLFCWLHLAYDGSGFSYPAAAPSEKHKARAFVCTVFLIRGLRAEIRCRDNLDFPDRFYKKLLFFGDDTGGKKLAAIATHSMVICERLREED